MDRREIGLSCLGQEVHVADALRITGDDWFESSYFVEVLLLPSECVVPPRPVKQTDPVLVSSACGRCLLRRTEHFVPSPVPCRGLFTSRLRPPCRSMCHPAIGGTKTAVQTQQKGDKESSAPLHTTPTPCQFHGTRTYVCDRLPFMQVHWAFDVCCCFGCCRCCILSIHTHIHALALLYSRVPSCVADPSRMSVPTAASVSDGNGPRADVLCCSVCGARCETEGHSGIVVQQGGSGCSRSLDWTPGRDRLLLGRGRGTRAHFEVPHGGSSPTSQLAVASVMMNVRREVA